MLRLTEIGDLRERVRIEDQSQTQNAAGGSITTWTEVATVWAKMEPVNERSLLIAGRDEAVFDWVATIRYRSDITADMRMVWKGRTFTITGFGNQDERRRYQRVRLTEDNAPSDISA